MFADLSTWRKMARACRWKTWYAARKRWTSNQGNPLCGYHVVGARCMFRACPLLYRRAR